MARVTYVGDWRKPIRHYAVYHEQHGIATMVSGGYRFRADGSVRSRLVPLGDVHLVLLGRVDLALQKRQEEEAAGGLPAMVTGHPKRP
jgi:hypothetical protein